jgi:hypothetical protein
VLGVVGEDLPAVAVGSPGAKLSSSEPSPSNRATATSFTWDVRRWPATTILPSGCSAAAKALSSPPKSA